MRRTVVAGVILVGAAASACGTTVADSRVEARRVAPGVETAQTVASQDAQTVLGDPVEQTMSEGGASAEVRAPSTASSAGVTVTPSTPGQVARRSVVPRPAGGASIAGARVTTPVQVGVSVSANATAAYKAAGFNIDYGDGKQQAMAVIDDINGRGGLGGRRITPVFDERDASDPSTTAVKEQAACEKYTRDNKVIAVSGALGATTVTLLPCLQKASVPYLANGGGNFYDQPVFDQFTYLLSPGMLNVSRVYPALVKRLVAQRYFTPWGTYPAVKVGIVTFDHVEEHRVIDTFLKPALQAAGHPSVVESYVAEDSSKVITEMQAVVLKLQQEQVSHVVIVDQGGGVSTFLTQVAETQQYHPRYAVNSLSAPGALLQTVASARQLEGAMGMGWNPLQDVDGAHDHVSDANPAWVHCKDIMTKAGVNMETRITAYAAGQYCDTLYVLVPMATQASGYTGKGLMQQAAGIGRSFQSALTTMGTNLTANRRDGVGAARDLAYDVACTCFQYRSEPYGVA
jgi:ABC-type branched-subunit amino acid transport system substrate-binding protein